MNYLSKRYKCKKREKCQLFDYAHCNIKVSINMGDIKYYKT